MPVREPAITEVENTNVPISIHRGHILALPATLIMPLAMLVPKALAVLFVVTILTALGWCRVYKRSVLWPPVSFQIPFAVFVVYAAISSAWSPTPFVSLKSSAMLGLMTFGGLFLMSFARRLEKSEIEILGRALFSGTIISLVLLCIENYTDISIWRWLKVVVMGKTNFVISKQPMLVYNSAMSVGVLIIWPLLLFGLGKWRLIGASGVLLGMVIFFWSESDTPVFAFFLGSLIVLLFWWAPKIMRVAFGSIVVAFMFIAPLIPGLFQGPDTIRAEMPYMPHSGLHRIMIWKVTAKHIAESPVAGLGMDTSRSLYGRETRFVLYFPSPDPKEPVWQSYFEPIPLHPHNGILQIWLELGAIGIAILGWIIFILIRTAGLCQSQPIVMGFCVSYLAIGSLSFGAWQSWWICAIWLSAAILVSRLSSVEQKSGEPAAASPGKT